MPVKGKHLLHLVPHGINNNEFKPLPKGDSSVEKLKKSLLGDGEYNFIVAFNSRNAHRKHPANLIMAFKSFCASIDQEQAKKCALIMHTDNYKIISQTHFCHYYHQVLVITQHK